MNGATAGLPLLGAGIAALAVVLLIPLLSPFALRAGLVDTPGGRKQHVGDIPLVGGVAIFTGYIFALLFIGVDIWQGGLLGVWLALIVLGLWDDTGHLGVPVRVAVQVTAIVLLCHFSGIRLEHVGRLTGGEPVMLGWLALPLTILGLIGIKNGINLIDGLDGLAGTQVLVVLFWFIALGLQHDSWTVVALSVPLAGAVLGFLVFNARLPNRPGRVFLGDHGSVLLGFTLGWFAVVGSQAAEAPAFTPMEAVWVLGLIVLDTIRVMLSRMVRRTSPFTPGRDHFHHLLLDLGLPVNAVVATLAVMSFLMGGLVWLGRRAGLEDVALLSLFLALSAGFFLLGQYLQARRPA